MRYSSIEILRTVAITLMVQVHFVENLSGVYGFVPTGFAAPLFTFLSGVSYRLWLNAQQARGKPDTDISKITIRRGLFLFGTGFLFNIFVWMPEDTFNWDILTFIGTALICLNLVRKLPLPIPLLICALVYAISPVLREVAEYPLYWTNNFFECDLTLSDVVMGFLVTGYFPLFPWIIYPIAGFMVASWIFPAERRAPDALNRLAAAGLCLLAVAVTAATIRTFDPTLLTGLGTKVWTMFPASMAYVMGTLGFAMAALVLMHRWIDHRPNFAKATIVGRVASTFSTHSFSIYLLHHVAHLWPLWIYGAATADEPTAYWQLAMPSTMSWPLSFLFLVCCYFLFHWMERTGKPSVETLMRWLCD